MVWEGATVAPTREALAPELRAEPGRRIVAVRAAARERRRREHLSGARLGQWRASMLTRWHRVMAAAGAVGPSRGQHAGPAEHLDEIPAAELGALLVGLEDVSVRDAILLSLASGARVDDPLGERANHVLDAIFAVGGPPPEMRLAQTAHTALVALASLAARHRAAAPLGMLAWLAGWCGEGARTDVLLQRCLEQDPEHRLARLLRHALDQGMAPGWAQVARSA